MVSLPFEDLLTAVLSNLKEAGQYRAMLKSLGFGSELDVYKFQPLGLQAV